MRKAAAPKVSAVWPFFGKQQVATMDAVISSVWRAEDGTIGLFLANLSETPQTYQYSFDPGSYGLAGNILSYTPITENGPGEAIEAEGGVQQRAETLEPFGVAIYEVTVA